MSDPESTHHKILEHQRGVVVSRLLDVVDELDRRRHAVTDVAAAVERKVVPVGLALATVGVASIVAYVLAKRSARRPMLASPSAALAHTVRSFARPEPASPARKTLTRVAGGILLTAATELTKLGARALLAMLQRRNDNGVRVR